MAPLVCPRYVPVPTRGHRTVLGLLPIAAFLIPTSANAMEVAWDGHYRTRVRYFNSLSLAGIEENERSEES